MSSVQEKLPPATALVGGFVVFSTYYGYGMGRVERITAQRAYISGEHTRYNKFVDLDRVAFCGAESVARLLLQQLESSRAQQQEDVARAQRNHYQRADDFIRRARKDLIGGPLTCTD